MRSPGFFAPRRAAARRAPPGPLGRKKSADHLDARFRSRYVRIAARRPAVRARYPLVFLGFPMSSRPVPPYPAFLSYLVCSQ